MTNSFRLFGKIFKYSFAGLLATLPMTVWMLACDRILPSKKEEPLPPEAITSKMAGEVGLKTVQCNKPVREVATTINHYLIGATAAIPFLVLGKANIGKGIFYGLLVWAGNYLGILPQLKLYPSATRKSCRLNSLMLVAHLIWGGVLGNLLRPSK